MKKTYNPNNPLWSIMTKTRAGTVSVVRELTLSEAIQTYERLDPDYGKVRAERRVHEDFWKDIEPSDGVVITRGSSMWIERCSDDDIEIREVFGPEGWGGIHAENIRRWPVYKIVWTDANGEILDDEFQIHPDEAAYERRRKEFIEGANQPLKIC